VQIAITGVEEQLSVAAALSEQYQIPLVTAPHLEAVDILLVVNKDNVACHLEGFQQPLIVDFPTGKAKYQSASLMQHPLVRAVGVKKADPPLTILDVTAGVGDDAYLLARTGCNVTMIERNPVIYLLLQDALKRLRVSSSSLTINLVFADAMNYLADIDSVDVIICDPMFPKFGKHAKVKKSMQFLQVIVGENHDAGALFQTILNKARKRIVVKRPKLAPPLANQIPDYSLKTKNYRFDVYLVFKSCG